MEKKMSKFILIFLYLQPLLDILTSFQNHFGNQMITIGVIVRILFLGILILYSFQKKDKKMFLYFCVFLIYLMIYSGITIHYKGTEVLFFELKNLFHIFYLPFLILGLNNTENSFLKEKHIIEIYFLYLLFIAIPTITNTSFESYTQGKVGSIGWFYSTNEISAILCLFMPIIFQYFNNPKYDIRIKIIFGIIFLFSLFTLGTKTTVLVFILLTLFYLLRMIYYWVKKREIKKFLITISLILLIGMGGIFFIPKTSFYQNIQIHLNFLGIQKISDIFQKENFDHFIFSQRLSFLEQTRNNYHHSNSIQKLFGIGYIENYKTPQENRKTIEMDYFDIFYRSGIIGTILFLYPFLQFLKRENRTSNKTAKISIWISLIIAGLVGHVLVAPAVSIYIAMLFTQKNIAKQE